MKRWPGRRKRRSRPLSLLGAQYSLAPALIEAEDRPHDLVVGNFSGQQDFARVGQEHSLAMVKDFGNGVILYRRQAH